MMEHLDLATLARYVDEAPDPGARAHLERCQACRHELEALRRQTRELGALPPIPPGRGAWPSLEARLREEGLVRDPGSNAPIPFPARPAARARDRLARAAPRLAAGFALFLAGAAIGSRLPGPAPAESAAWQQDAIDWFAAAPTGSSPVDHAAALLQEAESNYLVALARYSELAPERSGPNPLLRLAALESILHTTRAALDEAPGDPVLNGYHFTALAQRDAVLRHLVVAMDGPWF